MIAGRWFFRKYAGNISTSTPVSCLSVCFIDRGWPSLLQNRCKLRYKLSSHRRFCVAYDYSKRAQASTVPRIIISIGVNRESACSVSFPLNRVHTLCKQDRVLRYPIFGEHSQRIVEQKKDPPFQEIHGLSRHFICHTWKRTRKQHGNCQVLSCRAFRASTILPDLN